MSKATELKQKINESKDKKQSKLGQLNERLERAITDIKVRGEGKTLKDNTNKRKVLEFLSDEKWYFDALIKSTGFKIDPSSKFTGPSKGILVVDSATFNKLKQKSVIGTYGDFKILKSTVKNQEVVIEVEYRDYDPDIFTVTK